MMHWSDLVVINKSSWMDFLLLSFYEVIMIILTLYCINRLSIWKQMHTIFLDYCQNVYIESEYMLKWWETRDSTKNKQFCSEGKGKNIRTYTVVLKMGYSLRVLKVLPCDFILSVAKDPITLSVETYTKVTWISDFSFK